MYIHKKFPHWPVINIDKLSNSGNSETSIDLEGKSNYRFIYGDINDSQLIATIIDRESIEIVINFANEYYSERLVNYLELFLQSNVLGGVSLLNVLKNRPNIRFIQISSNEVYGNNQKKQINEETVLKPESPYAASKASMDHFVQAYNKKYDLDFRIIRSSNSYGPHQQTDQWIPLLIKNALKQKPVTLSESFKEVENWLFIDDLCRGIECVLLNGKAGAIYNICGESKNSSKKIIKKICRILDYKETDIYYVPTSKVGVGTQDMDIKKITDLGWYQQVTLDEGISQTIDWYKRR